jgi:hypothetical protein
MKFPNYNELKMWNQMKTILFPNLSLTERASILFLFFFLCFEADFCNLAKLFEIILGKSFFF